MSALTLKELIKAQTAIAAAIASLKASNESADDFGDEAEETPASKKTTKKVQASPAPKKTTKTVDLSSRVGMRIKYTPKTPGVGPSTGVVTRIDGTDLMVRRDGSTMGKLSRISAASCVVAKNNAGKEFLIQRS